MSIESKSLIRRITVSPGIMTGKPTIRGLRITVEQVLKALAAGVTQHELLEEYPELEQDDIHAVLLYAAERVGEDKIIGKFCVYKDNNLRIR